MLYVTTRNKNDAHTAHKTLTTDRGADGGFFVPFQIPAVSQAYIDGLKDKSFGQSVADILNIFFNARLDGWDVDFSIGRNPVKMVPMSRRIVVAETWHNPDWDFARIVRNLSSRIQGNDDTLGIPSAWAWIAVRIATLFGLYGQMQRQGLTPGGAIDVAVAAGDFSGPMAIWLARQMGLPVGTIICACDEDDKVWDLLHQGQVRTDSGPSDTLERLIYSQFGTGEVLRYLDSCAQSAVYAPAGEVDKSLYVAVVSQKRTEAIIYNVYRTCTYLLDPNSASAYGGLQDYRSTPGEGRLTLLLTERSPVRSMPEVAKAMGIPEQELLERITKA